MKFAQLQHGDADATESTPDDEGEDEVELHVRKSSSEERDACKEGDSYESTCIGMVGDEVFMLIVDTFLYLGIVLAADLLSEIPAVPFEDQSSPPR